MRVGKRAITRRAAVGGMVAAALGLTRARAQTAPQGTWPDRTVKIVVPYPAGGSTDVLARILAEQLGVKLGQTFIIENRPGAGGNIGITAVTSSPPDGYTIGAATVGHFSINQYLYARMPYDPEKDFVAVTLTWELPNVLVVSSEHCPAKTLAEFIAWAKSRGNIAFGSPGVGTTPHLSGSLLSKRTGIEAVHVPFRGAAQTIPAILAGDVQYALDNLASYISNIEAGSMRALAVTSAQRWPTLQEVPTMAEAGLGDFVVTSWAGWVVPAGTPRPVIDKLAAAQQAIAAGPEMQKRFLVAGARVLSSTPEQIAAQAAKERPMWQEMVKVSGATPQ
jgi:tripartite-type tricarboxylate transporter receptor subunit TctC